MFKQEEWQALSNKGFYLIHLSMNCLLPKTVELREQKEQKLLWLVYWNLNYCTVLDPEIHTKNYKIICFNRNWHGGGVACYIRSDINYKLTSFLSNEIENISFDILRPHSKAIRILVIYRPPS